MSIREDLEALMEEGEELSHQAEHELKVAQEQLQSLLTIQRRIETEKGISRTQAQTLKTVATGLESMESHFLQYPVLSYSLLPSKTNLKVTQEGIGSVVWETIKRIAKAILNAIVKGWNFLASLAKKIYGFFFRTQKAAKAVSESSKIVKDVYMTVYDALSEDARERLTAEVMTYELGVRKQMESKWNMVLNDIMLTFTTGGGVDVKTWSTLPAKLIQDCVLFNFNVTKFNERIEQNGVTGLIEGSETIADVFGKWKEDVQVLKSLTTTKSDDAIALIADIHADTASNVSAKKSIDGANLHMLNEVGQKLSDLINGAEGARYSAMLLEVSKNAANFAKLDKSYQKLLSSLKEPDDRVNNDALVSLKSMMTSIDQGFKTCATINQEFNVLLGFINENNNGVLKLYLKAAKEGGLSDEQKKDVENRLKDLRKTYALSS